MTQAKLKVLVKNTESDGSNSVPGLLLWPYQILAEKSGVKPSALCHNLSPNLTSASEQCWSTEFKKVK